MTAIADGKTIINILTGGTSDNAQLLRIADAFVEYAGTDFQPASSPATNEELAQNFLDMLRRFGRSVVRASAERGARADNDATVTAAGDAAEADL